MALPSVHVVDDTYVARALVIGTIPEGSSVMTNPSMTLDEAGISPAINEGGEFDSIRKQLGEGAGWPQVASRDA